MNKPWNEWKLSLASFIQASRYLICIRLIESECHPKFLRRLGYGPILGACQSDLAFGCTLRGVICT